MYNNIKALNDNFQNHTQWHKPLIELVFPKFFEFFDTKIGF